MVLWAPSWLPCPVSRSSSGRHHELRRHPWGHDAVDRAADLHRHVRDLRRERRSDAGVTGASRRRRFHVGTPRLLAVQVHAHRPAAALIARPRDFVIAVANEAFRSNPYVGGVTFRAGRCLATAKAPGFRLDNATPGPPLAHDRAPAVKPSSDFWASSRPPLRAETRHSPDNTCCGVATQPARRGS